MRDYQVITIGEATIDCFMSLQKMDPQAKIDYGTGNICFKHGEKIDIDKYDFCVGGNATNVAIGLSRLGLTAALCTEIGDDENSLKIQNTLEKENIDRFFVKQTKDCPSNFSVVINFKGDRTIFVKNLDREHNFQFDRISSDYIYLTSLGREWKNPYQNVIAFAEKNGAKVAFNPGSLQLLEGRDVLHKVLKKTDILFVNKEEGERILFGKNYTNVSLDHEYIKELLVKLQRIGSKLVILTNGKHGSFALEENGEYHYCGISYGEVVERTGAGDAFTSGFLGATIHGLPVADAMVWGSLNAASVVGKVGAQAGLLPKEKMQSAAKT
jgi:ribokinase